MARPLMLPATAARFTPALVSTAYMTTPAGAGRIRVTAYGRTRVLPYDHAAGRSLDAHRAAVVAAYGPGVTVEHAPDPLRGFRWHAYPVTGVTE